MNILNKILFRHKGDLILDPDDGAHIATQGDMSTLVAFMFNVKRLGYVFSPAAVQALLHYTEGEIKNLWHWLEPVLRIAKGADYHYEPMYPNFPAQVADASAVELFVNAIVHYVTFGYVLPEYQKEERVPLDAEGKADVINKGTLADVGDVFRNLLSSPTSLSEDDVADVCLFVRTCPAYADYIPPEIPFKETVALLAAEAFLHPTEGAKAWLFANLNTATDVLRTLAQVSNGADAQLTTCRFRKLTRPQRRLVMDLLANCGYILEDLYRYRAEWLRVGEIVHPFEFRRPQYKGVVEAFDVLRNHKQPVFFARRVGDAIASHDVHTACALLQKRAGEFARRLDKLLRDNPADSDYILDAFARVAPEVATPLLLHLRTHFASRDAEAIRAYFPRSSSGTMQVFDKVGVPIDKAVTDRVVEVCTQALLAAYTTRAPLGKVYVDEELRRYAVPFSQRSASSSGKLLTRGSRIPFEGKVMRAFIWWTNQENGTRVDLDLSTVIFDDEWNYMTSVFYFNLRDSQYNIYHSGDIINGGDYDGKGVSEFLDVDVDKVLAKGGRYVMFSVHSFNLQTFDRLGHAAFGWMERNDVNSGEIFEPATVALKMSLSSHANAVIPVIFDCVERRFLWCDLALYSTQFLCNVEHTYPQMRNLCCAMWNMVKPNMYELAVLNATARGELVDDPAEADVVFEAERVAVDDEDKRVHVSAYDVDYIMGELL